MRRFLFGVVIASVTAATPVWAYGGDREIAKSVMTELQTHKASGELKGFDIDLKVEDGRVYLTGQVASQSQRALVLEAATNAVGESNVVNELSVKAGQAEPSAPSRPVQRPVVRPATEPVVQPVAKPQLITKSPVRPASTTEVSRKPSAQDMRITDAIIDDLQQAQDQGILRGFELDVSTVGGEVLVRGKVSNSEQKAHVLKVVRNTSGVGGVIDKIDVPISAPRPMIRQASNNELAPAAQAPVPVPVPRPVEPTPQGSSMPMAGRRSQQPIAQQTQQPVAQRSQQRGRQQQPAPQPFARSGLASAQVSGGHVHAGQVHGGPVAMHGASAQYGMGAPRYDQPNMPGYAWPSYAAHPNYAAVTYPKQYSPSAWPYIGPFYPYPQVPLGWRKVSLEWDDGLWYLDFTSK